jgi:hypothetical protein
MFVSIGEFFIAAGVAIFPIAMIFGLLTRFYGPRLCRNCNRQVSVVAGRVCSRCGGSLANRVVITIPGGGVVVNDANCIPDAFTSTWVWAHRIILGASLVTSFILTVVYLSLHRGNPLRALWLDYFMAVMIGGFVGFLVAATGTLGTIAFMPINMQTDPRGAALRAATGCRSEIIARLFAAILAAVAAAAILGSIYGAMTE